jgi:hypothetical protein
MVTRAVLPPRGVWFAHLLPSGDIDPQVKEPGIHRRCRLNKDLHEWLARVELPYHSPPKFRHGHATYALKRCKDAADLKAVSQNLMHSSLTVTDSICGVLSSEDAGRTTDSERQYCVTSWRPDAVARAKRNQEWAHQDSNQGPIGGRRRSSSAMVDRDPDAGQQVSVRTLCFDFDNSLSVMTSMEVDSLSCTLRLTLELSRPPKEGWLERFGRCAR